VTELNLLLKFRCRILWDVVTKLINIQIIQLCTVPLLSSCNRKFLCFQCFKTLTCPFILYKMLIKL